MGQAVHAFGLAERLDDSASPRSRVTAPMQWSGGADSPVATAQVRIEYRLATARYQGRNARIYWVIPPLIPGVLSPQALEVSWRGQSLFAQGKGYPGSRSLVWAGVVTGPFMADTLDVQLRVDMRQIRLIGSSDLGFEPYFDIEVLP